MLLEDFKPTSRLVTKHTLVERPRFPVIDAHNHLSIEFGGGWEHAPSAELLEGLDAAGVRQYFDLDGGWGEPILEQHLDHFKAAGVPLLLRVDGSEFASLQRDLQPGETFEWQVPWPNAKQGARVTLAVQRVSVTALFQDATPLDNALTWAFTPQALGREPLLPPDQQRRRSNPNTPDLEASSLAAPPLIDGSLDEWKDLPCYDINRSDQISYGDSSQWSGSQDLSGRVGYAWDAANLYVAFQIKDDQLVQQNSGSALWKGDHVELWFDTQLQLDFDSDTAGDDDFQVGLSPGDFQQVKPDFYIFAPAMSPAGWRGQVEYAVVKTPDGYAGEVKPPAKVLKGLRLVADNTIGVSFEPSDTDTPGSSEQELMMSLAPKSSSQWGNPTNWNNLTLKR